MAEVFLAVAHGAAGVAKLAVIKEPRPEVAADPELMEMFLDEARLAARLNHPNIVQTYEVGQEGARYFLAMEYLEGQPLSRIRTKLRHHGGMPLGLQVRVLAEALTGLHYAHELRDYDGTPLDVVHRDVTPQNLFVTYAGQTKLVDFGIAKASSSAVQTKTGVLKGKMSYMSPEQARGDRVDRRTDVYAVGVLLWEAISGKRMWKGLSDVALLSKITNGDLVPIREVAPGVPPELERILARAMAFHPSDRYPTAADMAADLEQYLHDSGERRAAAAIGALVTETFQEERRGIQAVIEQQLRRVEPRATFEELPRIDPGRLSGTGSYSGVTDVDGQSSPTVRTGGSLTSATASTLSAPPAPPPSQKRTAVFVAAVVLGALAAGTVFLTVGRGGDRPEGSAASAPSAPSTAAPAAPATVDLVIDVQPDNARVLLDDAVLSTGKYAGKLPREARVYKLRVEAPGYMSRVELLTPTQDVRLSISLDKEGDPAASAAPSAEPPRGAAGKTSSLRKPGPAAPAPAEPSSKPTEESLRRQNAPKPSRTLDTENPYAR
jgi:eukaryotic-like serine/threonine-protein kinase